MHPRRFRFAGAVMLFGVAAYGAAAPLARLRAESRAPVSYACVMDADVVEDEPGACRVCGMTLRPVRIETAWSCPIHAVVVRDQPGACEFDGRTLLPVTVNHFWDCPATPGPWYVEPGGCADGRPRREQRLVRAHGDHNPRHGGQLFMTADQAHHVEGAYPAPHLFRLYVYDNFTRPVALDGVGGRILIVSEGGRDPVTAPLRVSADRRALEAAIATHRLPQNLTVKVRFGSNGPENHFDFTFPGITKEPASVPTAAEPVLVRPEKFRFVGAVPPRVAAASGAAAPEVARPPTVGSQDSWPGDIASALAVMGIRTREIRTLIDQGNFTLVYAPAILAKDLALGIVDHLDQVPEPRRAAMSLAVRRLVLAAWTLDRDGDIGNRELLLDAHADFASAVDDMKRAYDTR